MKKKFGRRSLIFILTFIILAVSTVIAAVALDYKDNNITWKFTVNGENATITGVTLTGKTKEFKIPSTVTSNGTTYKVTAINNSAFINNKNVFGKLTLPSELTTIGSSAFEGTYIYGSVEIPESVTAIGSSAFKNCDGITEVKLPSALKTLNTSTFEGCFALSKINTENIETYGEKCFYNCRALYDFTIGKNTKKIHSYAFYNCDAIEGTLDNSMLSATSSDNTPIASYAFQKCDRIETVILPDSGINFDAYYECSNIQNYEVLATNPMYSSVDGVLHTKDGTAILKYPSTRKEEVYKVSDKVTTINSNIFNGTKDLKEVVLTNNVTLIKQNAFAGSSIEFIYIPDSVKLIDFNTFKDCKSLQTVIFGEGVEVIGSNAFSGSSVKLIIAGNDKVTPLATTNGKFYYASEYHCQEHIYGYNDNPPTCENYGYNKCIACLRYEYVEKTNHNGAIIETGEVTCTQDGYRIVKCVDCGQEAKAITEKAIGHVSNGKTFSIIAGYKSPFVKYSTCLVCGCLYVAEYSANFRILGDVNCNSTVDFYDLTALENYVADKASAENFEPLNADLNSDGDIDEKDIKILTNYLVGITDSLPVREKECTNHGKKKTLVIFEQSCESVGFRIRYCDSCGKLTDEIIEKKLEHTYDSERVIPASCAFEGQRIAHCATCDKTIYETIEKKRHNQNWYAVEGQRGLEYSTCVDCGEFEYREVSYSEFEKLIDSLPLICTCRTKCNRLTDNLLLHLCKSYYRQETYNAIYSILENYSKALTQSEINKNVRSLSNTLKNAQYNVTDVPSIFIESVPDAQRQGYLPTRIIVASLGEDGTPKIDAIEYNGQVKIRGRSSDDHAKKPYNIKFSSSVNLFDMGGGKKYCLLSNNNDSTLLRNALMFELSYLFGIDYSCKYKVVDLYTEGTYAGSYLLTTPVDVGEDRVDIDEETDFLLEIEKQFDTDDESQDKYEQEEIFSPIFNMRTAVNAPEIQDMSGEALSLVHKYIMEIDFAIYSGDWALIQEHIDVESVAKYYVLHDYLKEIDIIWDSTRFYIKEGKLYAGPA